MERFRVVPRPRSVIHSLRDRRDKRSFRKTTRRKKAGPVFMTINGGGKKKNSIVSDSERERAAPFRRRHVSHETIDN